MAPVRFKQPKHLDVSHAHSVLRPHGTKPVTIQRKFFVMPAENLTFCATILLLGPPGIWACCLPASKLAFDRQVREKPVFDALHKRCGGLGLESLIVGFPEDSTVLLQFQMPRVRGREIVLER